MKIGVTYWKGLWLTLQAICKKKALWLIWDHEPLFEQCLHYYVMVERLVSKSYLKWHDWYILSIIALGNVLLQYLFPKFVTTKFWCCEMLSPHIIFNYFIMSTLKDSKSRDAPRPRGNWCSRNGINQQDS